MRTDLNEAIKADLLKALEEGICDQTLAKIRKQMADLVTEAEEDLDYRLKDGLAQNLVGFVADMAKQTIEAILAGNEDEMRRYLGCERGAWTGRSDSCVWGRKREIDEWHPVIHGTLFEQGGLKLRRDIVASHRDLITDERIKDLEDQVASLVAQVNKAEREKEELRERYR